MAKPSLTEQLSKAVARNTSAHMQATAKQSSAPDLGHRHTSIPLNKITPNPFQPRIEFDPIEIENLALSISELGLMQPIVVRPLRNTDPTLIAANDEYQIIAGERRWRAHQILQRPTIEAVIIVMADHDMALAALAENLQRANLSDFEVAQSIRGIELALGDRIGSKAKLAEDIGIARSDLYRYYAYDALPSFIIDSLKVSPKTLSRAAASDLKSAMDNAASQGITESVRISALRYAWDQLEHGKITQGQIAHFFIKELSKVGTVLPDSSNNPLNQISNDRNSDIFWKKSGKSIILKLPATALPSHKEAELTAIIRLFLSNIEPM